MNSVVRAVSIEAEVTASDFRNAMRQLTGGVSVITAGKGRDISGMTVTSVSSLSVDPPSLIVSLNRESSSWPLVKRYGFFGVNILTSDQVDIAERFTGKGGLKGADRFAGAPWTTRASGVPLLADALAAIDCEGRGCCRAAFACDRYRPRAGCCGVGTHRGAGLLAGALCRHRSGRGCGEACRGQRAGAEDRTQVLIGAAVPRRGWLFPGCRSKPGE
jgi:flavin reductase (DIM6/NTAB) family NADH-FMN oxidoreductase RutF